MGIWPFLPERWGARWTGFGVGRNQDRRDRGVGIPGVGASSTENRMAKQGCKQEPGATPASAAHRLVVFLWPQISPDVKRKACHPFPQSSSCPEAALCIPPRPPLPISHWSPASCLPGPWSGSHRHIQNSPRGSLHTSDAHCLCRALSSFLHGSVCAPVPGGITSHSHARPAWLLSLPTQSLHHLRRSYRRSRVTQLNHR